MNNEYDIKKMYFCKFDCPLKNNISKYIKEDIEDYFQRDIDVLTNKRDKNYMQNSLDSYESEFKEEICENLCPVDKFINEL